MSTRRIIALAALLTCWAGDERAAAQYNNYNPASRYTRSYNNYASRSLYRNPSVSPYLNLLQNNSGLTSLTPNYQAFVRPQLEARRQAQATNRSLQTLGSQVGGLQQQLGQPTRAGGLLRPTGRPEGSAGLTSYYGNHLHYYLLQRR